MKKILVFILNIVLLFSLTFTSVVAENNSTSTTNDVIVGDVNHDGEIDAADVALIKRYIAGGFGVSIDENLADYDSNGVINAKDVMNLRKVIASEEEINSDDIIILYTNDVHCGIDDNIGYAGLAAYKKYCETLTSNVALVDCGDAIQGDIVGSVSDGEYIVDIMNKVGYDVAAIGNHEFDFGMEQLEFLFEKAEYEYLNSNITYTGSGNNIFEGIKPYTILTYGDVDIAFIGVATPFTIAEGTPKNFMEDGEFVYDFKSGDGTELYECVQENIDECKEKGAEYVILMTHLGESDEYSPYSSVDVIENTTGVDVVLDAHNHSVIPSNVCKDKNGEDVLLSSTGTKLENIGRLVITAEGEITTSLISNYEEKDAEIETFIDDLMKDLEAELNTVIGQSEILITGYDENGIRLVRNREATIGNFCTDAFRLVADADIALLNGGGIRANIEEGDITLANLITVMPYGKALCVVEASGQEIVDALEISVSSVKAEYKKDGFAEGENGSFLQVSGIRFTVDTSIESTVEYDEYGAAISLGNNRRVCNVEVLSDDGTYTSIELDGTYKVASHDYFLLNSGGGHNIFADNNIVTNKTIVEHEVLAVYITDYLAGVVGTEYSQTEGRITIK